ncbi:MAG TPA: hypothetical protein VFS50_16720 [Meiothermus sp.]|jgi:hypothetical protein|nr:hypothetical protein [Meiothermus sp.]
MMRLLKQQTIRRLTLGLGTAFLIGTLILAVSDPYPVLAVLGAR